MEINSTPSRSTKMKAGEAQPTFTLPEEIMEEILSRIAVKSLLRFRCVSKSWRSLIDSKGFIGKHLKNSTSLGDRRVMLVSLSHNRYETLSGCSLLSLFSKPDIHALESKFYDNGNKLDHDSISLVGCCNGLVCLFLNSWYFVLWNPSTRTSKVLPRTVYQPQFKPTTCYGFGYDESSGDYKVFWLDTMKDCKRVYSLKSGSWKTRTYISGVPLNCGGQGKFASGKLHWLQHDHGKSEIVAFDLSGEVHGCVEPPSPNLLGELEFLPYLGILDECVSVLCYYKTGIDVWVMKESNWQKLVILDRLIVSPWITELIPFCIGPEGEIMLKKQGGFAIYYEDGCYRQVGKHNESYEEAAVYVQSLVRLDDN